MFIVLISTYIMGTKFFSQFNKANHLVCILYSIVEGIFICIQHNFFYNDLFQNRVIQLFVF